MVDCNDKIFIPIKYDLILSEHEYYEVYTNEKYFRLNQKGKKIRKRLVIKISREY